MERECSKIDTGSPSAALLNEEGKCSALLTREGFFDFVVFRTQCNVSHNVMVVCQHDQETKCLLNNNMSDIKLSQNGSFYSLQVFLSCDAGWFLVDNVCITFSYCPNNSNDFTGYCADQDGQLSYHWPKRGLFVIPKITALVSGTFVLQSSL